MFLTINHALHILQIISLKQMIKIYEWYQLRIQKLTVNFKHWNGKQSNHPVKWGGCYLSLFISGSWERIGLFGEESCVSARLRHSERPDHRAEWDLITLEYSSNIVFRFEDQSKWEYKSIRKLLTLTLPSNSLQNSLVALAMWQEQPMSLQFCFFYLSSTINELCRPVMTMMLSTSQYMDLPLSTVSKIYVVVAVEAHLKKLYLRHYCIWFTFLCWLI